MIVPVCFSFLLVWIVCLVPYLIQYFNVLIVIDFSQTIFPCPTNFLPSSLKEKRMVLFPVSAEMLLILSSEWFERLQISSTLARIATISTGKSGEISPWQCWTQLADNRALSTLFVELLAAILFSRLLNFPETWVSFHLLFHVLLIILLSRLFPDKNCALWKSWFQISLDVIHSFSLFVFHKKKKKSSDLLGHRELPGE